MPSEVSLSVGNHEWGDINGKDVKDGLNIESNRGMINHAPASLY
jgi:hypothetical protein